jgi:hypothetical protein
MCTGRTCTQQFLDREWTWAATYSSIQISAGQHRCKKLAIWQNKQCSRDSLFKENSIWEALASQQGATLSYCNCRPTEQSGCCPHLTHLLHTSNVISGDHRACCLLLLCSESLPVDQGHGSVNHEARSIKHPVQSPPNLLYSNSLFSTCPFLTALRRERRVLFGVTWTLKSVSDSSAAALHPRHKEDPANSSLLPAATRGDKKQGLTFNSKRFKELKAGAQKNSPNVQ